MTGLGLLQEVFDGGLAAFERSQEQAAIDRQVTFLVLDLALRGYSTQQILEGLMVGSIIVHVEDDIKCVYVATTDRTMVRPVRPPADIFIELACPAVPEAAPTDVAGATTTTTTTEAASSTTPSTTTSTTTTVTETLEFPRTYVGGASTWSLSVSNGSCRVDGNMMELVLNVDGTLTGTYQRIEPTFFAETPPGASRATVECGDQIFTQDPIAVTGSHEVPAPGTDETGTVVVEIVGWPDWHIEGEYTPSGMTFTWEVSYTATGYEGDEPDPRIITVVDYQLLFVDES